MEFHHVIYGIGRAIHSQEKRCEKWWVPFASVVAGRWKVHQRSASCRRGKVNGGWIELHGEEGKAKGGGARMAKRWDDSRFPWAFRSKGYIRALRRTFQFALKSPGPGLMPLINIRDNPPRVSPFPTGNTCKPRLYQPLGSPKESRMGTPNLELDFTWNELLPVVGRVMSLEGCEERSGSD